MVIKWILYIKIPGQNCGLCTIMTRRFNELPSVSGLACVFAKFRRVDESLVSRWNCRDGEVPISRQDLSCHDKVVLMAMQKPWQLRVGLQPYWLCLDSRISHGTEILISWIKPDRIDLWSWLLSSPGCWRQLPIPSVLCGRSIFLLVIQLRVIFYIAFS